jgi:hydroxymethylglutaryl-CoA synthase
MKPDRNVGIWGYGAYIPRFRVQSKLIAEVWRPKGGAAPPVSQKSVLSYDEDAITMAIDAARTALRRSTIATEAIGGLWVGSESKPYEVKPTATLVAAALGVRQDIIAGDIEFACKAGSVSMQMAVAGIGSGMLRAAVAIGVDAAQARPGDVLEYTASCGAAAFVFGPASGCIATVDDTVAFSTNTPDFFRREGAAYPQHGGRFTEEPGYYHHTLTASRMFFEQTGTTAGDYQYAIFHQPIPKLVERAAKTLGFNREQLEAGFCINSIGNAYAGSSGLGLAAVLDVAKPGDRIFFCCYGSGAGSDVFGFTVTDQIEARRDCDTIANYMASGVDLPGYGHYLRLTGAIRM